jgi:5-methylcytosine-specific restriction endonuclease McrA
MNKYIGNKKNRLKCLYFDRKEKNVNLYVFLCDCGNIKSINPIKVFGKNASTKSCGCLKKENGIILGTKYNNVVNVSIERTKKEAYYKYCSGAKKRNYAFELSFEKFISLVTDNCHYCCSEPSLKQKLVINKIHENPIFLRNGVDRMNNNLGYTLDNCVTCCNICNRAKNNMEYKDFKIWIENLKKYNK